MTSRYKSGLIPECAKQSFQHSHSRTSASNSKHFVHHGIVNTHGYTIKKGTTVFFDFTAWWHTNVTSHSLVAQVTQHSLELDSQTGRKYWQSLRSFQTPTLMMKMCNNSKEHQGCWRNAQWVSRRTKGRKQTMFKIVLSSVRYVGRQGLALCGHYKAVDESGKRVWLKLKIIHNSLSGWRSLRTDSQAQKYRTKFWVSWHFIFWEKSPVSYQGSATLSWLMRPQISLILNRLCCAYVM